MKKILFVFSLFLLAHSAHAAITTGLERYWQFDEGNGITTRDSSHNTNDDGVLQNGLAWIAGFSGQALHFDGNDDYVDLPNGDTYLNLAEGTISMWYKSDGYTSGGSDYLYDCDNTADAISVKLTNPTTIKFSHEADNGGTHSVSITVDDVNESSNWHFISFTWDASRDVVTANYDGKTTVFNINIDTGTFDSSNSTIGSFDTGTLGFWNGAIDEVRIYNRALSEPEVSEIYNIGSTVQDPVCGDGSCNGSETCSSCPSDCGTCPVQDTTAPIIYDVSTLYVTQTTSAITWTTNEASDSQVDYGLTAGYGIQTMTITSMNESHLIGLANLSSDTTYHYRVRSKDAAGNEVVSGDYTFTTEPRSATVEQTQKINPSTDLLYLGTFQAPSFDDGMTYYPDGDPNGDIDGFSGSLMGASYEGSVTEFAIPAPAISPTKDISAIPVAQVLKVYEDITGGSADGSYTGSSLVDVQYLPRQGQQSEDKLYWVIMTHYVTKLYDTFGWNNVDFSNPNMSGVWHLLDYSEHNTSQYLFEIPKHWADRYLDGKYLIGGKYRMGPSGGPALFAFAPWQHGNPPDNTAALEADELLYYKELFSADNFEQEGRMNDLSSWDFWIDGAWIEVGDKSAVILVGSKGEHHGYYGLPLPDGLGGYSGYRSNASHISILFYDPNEFIDVIEGRKKSDEPQPYAMMQAENHAFRALSRNPGNRFNGVGYDRLNNLLYIAQQNVFDPATPNTGKMIVHVFKVIDAGQPYDTIPPGKPDNITAIRNLDQIDLSWDPATDDNGRVMYVISRKGVPNGNFTLEYRGVPIYGDNLYSPIGVTTDSHYSDENYMYFKAPYEYRIEARDVVNNSNSNEIIVETDRIEIDTSSFVDGGASLINHELPQFTADEPYAFQFKASGGTPPYKWSSSFLFPGMTLDPDSGLLSGVPSLGEYKLNHAYSSIISVEDSGSPVPNKASIYKLYMTMVEDGDSVTVESRQGKAFGMGWLQEAIDAKETSDGGFVIVGFTKGLSFREDIITHDQAVKDLFIVKTDSEGNEVLRRVIGERGGDIVEVQKYVSTQYAPSSIIETDNGFLVSGTREKSYNNGTKDSDGFIIQVDNDLNFQWKKTYGGNQKDVFRTRIIRTQDNNYVVGGYTKSFSGGGCYIVKIDSSGNIIWEKVFGTDRNDCKNIIPNDDGTITAVGYAYNYYKGMSEDIYLAKITGSGNLIWNKEFERQGIDFGWDLCKTDDGGYLISGTSGESEPHTNNAYLLKVDHLGNVLWDKTYGGTSAESLSARRIVKKDENFILGGYSKSNSEPYMGMIMSVDSNGDLLWRKEVGNFENEEYLWSLSNTTDGGFVMSGLTVSFTTAHDMYFAKLDSQGNSLFNTNCTAFGTYYYDKDLDGYGSYSGGSYLEPNKSASDMCIATIGYVKTDNDCDDNDPNVYPGGPEDCDNGVDEN